MQTFTFDCELIATIRLSAETVADGRRLLAAVLECATTNFGEFPDGSPVIGEVSLADGPLSDVVAHASDLDAIAATLAGVAGHSDTPGTR